MVKTVTISYHSLLNDTNMVLEDIQKQNSIKAHKYWKGKK